MGMKYFEEKAGRSRKSAGNVLGYIGLSVLSCVIAFTVLFSSSTPVLADSFSYQFSVQYDQTGARNTLSQLNSFRTGSDAWAWDQNGNKVYYSRGNLTYDYNLEQIAMQRAAELIPRFAHTRPDGSKYSSYSYGGTVTKGENCSVTSSLQYCFDGLLETNKDYSGQDHRRTMLSVEWDFNAVGIAHVIYNGRHYYVQEFGFSNSGASYTSPVNGTMKRTITFDMNNLEFFPDLTYTSTILPFGGQKNLPEVIMTLRVPNTGSQGITVPNSEATIKYTSKNTSIARIEGDKIVGVQTGQTDIIVHLEFRNWSGDATVPVTVTKATLTENNILPISSYIYSGSEVKPTVYVTFGTKSLQEGRDYTLSYEYNVNPGTAYAVVTGIGNYTGTARRSFTIMKKDFSSNDISVNVATAEYDKTGARPKVEVKHGNNIVSSSEYTLQYSNNFGTGTAYVLVTANSSSRYYTGSKNVSFIIWPLDLSTGVGYSYVDYLRYSGKALTPDVTIKDTHSSLLEERVDYVLEYSNNIHVGTGKVVAHGIGNCTGDYEMSFSISPISFGLAGITMDDIPDQYYYGKEVTVPTYVYNSDGIQLVEGVDYTVKYKNNDTWGEASVTIEGIGDYSGRLTKWFRIYYAPTPTEKPKVSNTPTPTPKPQVTNTPTKAPTKTPTKAPTKTSTPTPTKAPTRKPVATLTPTRKPTPKTTSTPRLTPTTAPTGKPQLTTTAAPRPTTTAKPRPTSAANPTVTSSPTGTKTPTPTKTVVPSTSPRPSAAVTPGTSPKPTGNVVPRKAVPSVSPSITPTLAPGQGQTTVTPANPTPTKPASSQEEGVTISDFIERLYTIALNRPSEAGGKNFWVNEITSGRRTGGECAHFFLIEAPEFLNRGLSEEDFVETLYRTFFGRNSEVPGKQYWVSELNRGAKSREDVIRGFIDSTEWCNICAKYGVRSGAPTAKAEIPSQAAVGFATRLYTCCLGREPEKDGLAYWSLALTNLEQTGCSAAKFFFNSDEVKNMTLSIDEYIRRLYTTFMDREPAWMEVLYWMSDIVMGRQTLQSVLQYFGQSEEFTNICASYGIERGTM